VQVTFSANSDLRQAPGDQALCLFRVAQEALRNAATHGDARRVSVDISATETSIELTVLDDGTGFDVDGARLRGGGLGLISMEERSKLAGGEIRIDSRLGHGTTVRVRVAAGVPPIGSLAAETASAPERAMPMAGPREQMGAHS
jgi:signal transduction histidine kinase